MKILAISDTESPYLYEHFDINNFKDIELVLSAGDLKSSYLSYIATVMPCPVLYIHGNHDYKYHLNPPEGCICIENQVYTFKNIKIAGIGGCMEYSGGPYQYKDSEMSLKILKNTLKYRKGFDILLTHSPPLGIGDGEDQAHIGFKSFIKLLDKYKPKIMVHGHQHLNYKRGIRQHSYKNTLIINAYGYTIFEI